MFQGDFNFEPETFEFELEWRRWEGSFWKGLNS
jgi:hypothetical protein